MVEGLTNKFQEVIDELAKKHPTRIIERKEIADGLNERIEEYDEVDLEYRIKRAQSERDASYIFITA